MPLHPATWLAAWIACASALPWLGSTGLALVSALLLPGLTDPAVRDRSRALLRRTRLLLAALFVVYSFGTPGAALFAAWPAVSPTLAGVVLGVLQAWRLALLLASLAWLLTGLGRSGTLAAIYTLVRPLGALGLPVERFAVRLALVLSLADTAPRMKLSPAGLAAALDRPPAEFPRSVTVDLPPFTWRDGLCLLLLVVALGVLLW